MFPKGCLLCKINYFSYNKQKYLTNNTLVFNTRPTRNNSKFITVKGQRQ